ncbi:hypothetical protein [Pseudonocardia sp.]|uniref:hypothetical protein n=1 Tax=Pseudonocardia sp. TaxID=60912 RepID=UPI00262F360A|nr:hypothetical protein [Pseudonocardia sp.]
MPVHDPPTTGRRGVTRALTEEFAGLVPPDVVGSEVAAAARELRGQVPEGSLDEMLHRLASYRLRGWAVVRR